MSHDIVIRGGQVVDGTGSEPITADVAIDGDTITEIGRVDGKGKEEINADGLAVSPGFVDLHTHLDAQIGWDPQVTSVTWHGVTTVVIGNCGFGIAPTRPEHRNLIMRTLEKVEGMSLGWYRIKSP